MTRTMLSGTPIRRLRLLSRHFALPPPSSSSSLFPTTLSLLHRSLSITATARTDASPSTAWTFTTSAAFHGKPVSRSRRSGPEGGSADADSSNGLNSRGKRSVQQGLAPDHPLCQWRDQHLAEGKAPKEIGAGHDWWFVEGLPAAQGEGDTSAGGTRGVVLGVADGVGGWEDSGVDPSHFAQALMWFARERVRTSTWTWPTEKGSKSAEKLKDLLDGAFKDVSEEKGIVAGSSTACLALLDAETGMFHAANLGDSGFFILRPQRTDSLPPTPPATPPADGESAPEAPPLTPAVTYSVLHAQEPQVHFFNAPRQLSKIPAAELARAGGEGNWLIDRPRDADTFEMQLEDGDVIMLFTDGYSDNVWPSGETDRLLELVRSRIDTAALSSPSSSESSAAALQARTQADKELASSIAQTAVTFARMIAVRPDVYTPFAAESKRWQVKGMERGGKVDDVTVVVGVVRKETVQ
ncbi:hypothetical protein JCM10908_000826 [Rhodotorula pacifica]|uniref:uncharacterized protein n=1 Tax=Rhodotorula pacifica TaxID=1495444 RepID=UPI00317885CF